MAWLRGQTPPPVPTPPPPWCDRHTPGHHMGRHCDSPTCPWWKCPICGVTGGRVVRGIVRWVARRAN